LHGQIVPTHSLFAAQRSSTYSQGNMGKFGETVCGVKKVACGSTKAAISLTPKIEQKLQCRAYRKSQTLFRTVPSCTPYGLPIPKIGGSQPHPKTAIAIIPGTAKDTDGKFGRYIHQVNPNKAHEKIWRKESVRVSRDGPNFWSTPILSRVRVKL